MSIFNDTNFEYEVTAGRRPGKTPVLIRGLNLDVGTTEEDIGVSAAGIFQWPTTYDTIEVISDDANDTAFGTGARGITIVFLDGTFALKQVILATNGLTPSLPSGLDASRIITAFVSAAGTYSTTTDGGNLGNIDIRFTGGQVLARILNSNGRGRSLDFRYTVPLGKRLLIKKLQAMVDSNKVANMSIWTRGAADDIVAPFSSKLEGFEIHGITGGTLFTLAPDYLIPALDEKTDIWISGKMETGSGIIEAIAFGVLEDL